MITKRIFDLIASFLGLLMLALQEDPIRYNDEVIFPDKVRINLMYLEKQNLWLDLRIIVCTVFKRELKGF